jgi:MFS family permease
MARVFADTPNVELMVRLILTITALFIALGGPLAGLLTDRWGRKPVLIVSTLLYAAAGVAGGLVDALLPILIGRALLGLAVAGVMTASIALVADLFSGQARTGFLGIQASFMAYGGVVFLLAGGALADLSWRAPFFIYLLSLPLLVLVLALIPEPKRSKTTDATTGTDTPFPWIPLLPVYLIAFMGMVVFYMLPVQLPFFLERNLEVAPSLVGVALALTPLIAGTVSLGYRRLRGRLDFWQITALMFLLIGIGYLLISQAGSYAAILPGLVVSGLGLGLLFPTGNVWTSSLAPAALRGRALGGLTTAVYLGQFLSPLLIQPERLGGLAASYRLTGLVVIALALALGLALLLIPRRGPTGVDRGDR